MRSEQRALNALNAWLALRGRDVSASTLNAWSISPHRDALIFTPMGERSGSSLYIVLGDAVAPFFPGTAPLGDAVEALRRRRRMEKKALRTLRRVEKRVSSMEARLWNY